MDHEFECNFHITEGYFTTKRDATGLSFDQLLDKVIQVNKENKLKKICNQIEQLKVHL